MMELERRGCPYCGGIVGHLEDCHKAPDGLRYGAVCCAACGEEVSGEDYILMPDHVEVVTAPASVLCRRCVEDMTSVDLMEWLDYSFKKVRKVVAFE